jgi:exopolyphosphatase / guanosine-5'-triphosphate,3'-diphosphate pyrophosphatase
MTGTKAAVDIGTNSMRLLIVTDDGRELGRWARVTGLGKGLDATGSLAEDAIARTVEVLADYGRLAAEHGVTRARAVATSASRDAANREAFFDRAEAALGFRPEVIPGTEEAGLAYEGATAGAPGEGPHVVIDIGGGSTEFVWAVDGEVTATSIDIGSVRLTDRLLPHRPATFDQLEAASRHVQELFRSVPVPAARTVIGVAGTWTSLAAIAQDLAEYDRRKVHGWPLGRPEVERLIGLFATQTIEETAAIPALDPARAPVILAGTIIARETMRHLGAREVIVSEHDLLDGIIAQL